MNNNMLNAVTVRKADTFISDTMNSDRKGAHFTLRNGSLLQAVDEYMITVVL